MNLSAASLNHPVKWSLTITIDNKLLLQHEANDVDIDKLFNDSDFVTGCSSYIECKKKYYRRDILTYLIRYVDLSKNPLAFDERNSGSIYHIAFNELVEKKHIDESSARKIVDWMASNIKSGRTPVLFIPKSPVLSDFPKMFVDEVGSFITIYEW